MNYMIVMKWTTDWDAQMAEEPGKIAPGIIGSMILMFINMGEKKESNIELDVIPNQKATM